MVGRVGGNIYFERLAGLKAKPEAVAEIKSDLKKLWEFLAPSYLLRRADCAQTATQAVTAESLSHCDVVLLLGSNDLSPPLLAAALFQQIFPHNQQVKIVASGRGGHATVLTPLFTPLAEADKYQEVLVGAGVPAKSIITEPNSTNTGQNIIFSQKVLAMMGLYPQRVALIQSPAAQLRANLVFERQWLGEWEYYVSFPPALPDIQGLSEADIGFHFAYALREVTTTIHYSYSPEYDFQTKCPIPQDIAAIILKYQSLFKDWFGGQVVENLLANTGCLFNGFRGIFEEMGKGVGL